MLRVICVIWVLLWLAGMGKLWPSVEHDAGGVGQCTPVKGWMEVGTAGLVGIMPFELCRRSLGGLRRCRRSDPGCRRSCAGRRVSFLVVRGRVQARSWPHGDVCSWQAGARKRGSLERRDGSPTRRRFVVVLGRQVTGWELRVEG